MSEDALIDLTKDRATLKALYKPPAGVFGTVDVPKLPFAILDGEGPPEQASIEAAVKALYTAIDSIRREAKTRMGKSFVEAPIEILYWADDMDDLATTQRENWHWRVQITLPVWADAQVLEDSVAEVKDQLGAMVPAWKAVEEGKCLQILHVGNPDDILDTLKKLYNEHLPVRGLEPSGPYHEIYLDDWSRVAPERRKVILRQPVRPSIV